MTLLHRMAQILNFYRRCSLCAIGYFLVFAGVSDPTFAQSTAPSSITPQTLRPDVTGNGAPVAVPKSDGLRTPSGAEGIRVALGSVDLEGGYGEVATQTTAVADSLTKSRVSLDQIYAAASEIEAIHARAGYVLVRAAVPPQSLSDGGILRIIIVDGFIESVDVSGLPARARKSVADRTAKLIGQRHMKLSALERPILIASEVPGLVMTSTLARGTEFSGARLILAGNQKLISGSIVGDNSLAAALGRYGISAQASINSAFGQGEQIYGFASSGYDLTKLLRQDNPVRVIGGGVMLPFGDGRFSINPELTFARTQPMSQIGTPQTRGNLSRLSLRASYIMFKARSFNLALDTALEHLDETIDAPMFNARISRDRFTVARIGFRLNSIEPKGGNMFLSGQISQGVGGAPIAIDMAPGSGFSRLGSDTDFTKLNLSFRAVSSVAKKWQLNIIAKGQTTFGAVVFRSEQSALEGSDALSAFVGGITAVDESVTIRIELERPFYARAANKTQLAPYGFIAAGYGRINNPTALENENLHAASFGAGLRISIPKIGFGGLGLALGLEYARGVADFLPDRHRDRLNATMSLRF